MDINNKSSQITVQTQSNLDDFKSDTVKKVELAI